MSNAKKTRPISSAIACSKKKKKETHAETLTLPPVQSQRRGLSQ